MSDSPEENKTQSPLQGLETRLRLAAISFPYPHTPDFVAKEHQRVLADRDGSLSGKRKRAIGIFKRSDESHLSGKRLAGTILAVTAVLFIILMFVTPVRARLIEWLRIGAVRIFLNQPESRQGIEIPSSIEGLDGEIALSEAVDQVPFQLLIPDYPADLNDPQWVYLQKINGTPVVIFVWKESSEPDTARLALYQIGEGDVFQKQLMQNIQETTVNGQWALWVEGPYLLSMKNGQTERRRVVQGRTLIWERNGVTYRLETARDLNEARKIAESLKPLEQK